MKFGSLEIFCTYSNHKLADYFDTEPLKYKK